MTVSLLPSRYTEEHVTVSGFTCFCMRPRYEAVSWKIGQIPLPKEGELKPTECPTPMLNNTETKQK